MNMSFRSNGGVKAFVLWLSNDLCRDITSNERGHNVNLDLEMCFSLCKVQLISSPLICGLFKTDYSISQRIFKLVEIK